MLCTHHAFADNLDNYRLSSDDQISIKVFNEPDLNIDKVKIAANGTISMPLIGQVNVKGLTVSEVEQELTKRLLQGYLKKPNVTIIIDEYRPFYINGEIKKPGSYPYRKGLTIQKAVTIAGGFTERAAKNKISLKSEDNVISDALITSKVKPGDVITISESFF